MFTVLYEEAAERDMRSLRKFDQRRVLDQVDRHLSNNPATATRRRKLLRGLLPPWNAVRPVWQLRVGDFRVFYDVDAEQRAVTIRAVRRKDSRTTKEIL